jgi:hypothetical protein
MFRLSFGNILEKFPEFLIHVLRYIPDRIVWNSIVSSYKKIYKKIKEGQEDMLMWLIFLLLVGGRHVIVEDHTFGDDRGFYVASIWES